MDADYKDDDEIKKDQPQFLQTPDIPDGSDEEDYKSIYINAMNKIIHSNPRRLDENYLEYVDQITECAMKISLSFFFDQNMDLLISQLLSVLQEQRNYIIETIRCFQVLIKFQDIFIADVFIKNGGLNVFLEITNSPDFSTSVINPILDTLSAIVSMSRVFCNFVLQKFPIAQLREHFMESEDKRLLCSIMSLIQSFTLYPLSNMEIQDIIHLFIYIFDNGIDICFAPSLASLSMILRRKGIEDLINQTNLLEKVLSLIEFNDIVKANVCRAIGCATQNPKISIEFDVHCVLDCLKSDVVDVATAAAYCVTLLVSNRSDFLETFNLFVFISELLITFKNSPFRTRPYVAESIISLTFLLEPEDLFPLINEGYWEVPILIFNEKDDIILAKKTFTICKEILLKCEENESTLYVVDSFIDENGFDSIQALPEKYEGRELLNQGFIAEVNEFLEHFSNEEEN